MTTVKDQPTKRKPGPHAAAARPLSILVPLIQEELKAGDQAAMAHYLKAGELLLEAKEQVAHGKWSDWVSHNFRLSIETARIYMKLAKEQNGSALPFSSLSDFVQKTSNPNYNKPHTVRHAPWDEAVKRKAETIDVEHMKKAVQAGESEAKLTQELGRKLVDIGYTVLAMKLHPDKGGSHEAMQRLNRVKDRLKNALRY